MRHQIARPSVHIRNAGCFSEVIVIFPVYTLDELLKNWLNFSLIFQDTQTLQIHHTVYNGTSKSRFANIIQQ
ncbi:PDZ and LIM domain protein 7-like X1 [Biomphalaria pfeifferi]|uniref:PDZ and LIM domain protein 7-like X1 n=1 Tax=Biomphalaria pfeifferi TaxID=112525 RepID=A0AAD8BUR5_BIOPF|nr:PDZ and LIM domain protein 7-like X1 [Biomphalaria pfeifferi]